MTPVVCFDQGVRPGEIPLRKKLFLRPRLSV